MREEERGLWRGREKCGVRKEEIINEKKVKRKRKLFLYVCEHDMEKVKSSVEKKNW